MKKNKNAFTFVELIIVVIIIAILSTIGMSSYTSSLSDSRDSRRIADFGLIKSALNTYNQKRGSYPNPGNSFEIQYSGTGIAYQGKLDKSVPLSTLDELPFDPKNKLNYSYSIIKNKQEFELVTTLENGDFPKALLVGTYKSVSKNILPTISIATGATAGTSVEIKSGSIDGDINRKLFIFNNNSHNLIYTFEEPYSIYNDGELSFSGLLNEAENTNNFWQNSDFRNCIEINQAKKMIIEPNATTFEYQILDENGILTNTGCTNSNS